MAESVRVTESGDPMFIELVGHLLSWERERRVKGKSELDRC